MSSLIQLPRPRIERERGGEGWMVIRDFMAGYAVIASKPSPNWTSWPPSNAGRCGTEGWPMTASQPKTAAVIAFPATKESRRAHARFQDDWYARLASISTLPASDLATGLTLMRHMSRKSRQAWPSLDTIAQLTGRNRTTVWRSIKRLKKAGLITAIRVGRGRYAHNRYSFTLPHDDPKIAPTHTLNPSNGCSGAISMVAPAHKEPLIEPLNSSRGASRTDGIENKGAIKNYAWQGQIVHLAQAQ